MWWVIKFFYTAQLFSGDLPSIVFVLSYDGKCLDPNRPKEFLEIPSLIAIAGAFANFHPCLLDWGLVPLLHSGFLHFLRTLSDHYLQFVCKNQSGPSCGLSNLSFAYSNHCHPQGLTILFFASPSMRLPVVLNKYLFFFGERDDGRQKTNYVLHTLCSHATVRRSNFSALLFARKTSLSTNPWCYNRCNE